MSKEIFLPQLTSDINSTFTHQSRFDHNGRPIDINFTVIDRGLYLTERDMCGIFGVSQQILSKHIDEVYKEINKGNDIVDNDIVHDFTIKRVKTPSAKSAILYYPHAVFIKLAFKINTLNANRIESHVISVMQELTTNDFVINQHALETNPTLPEKIFGRIAHHFSPQRHDMAEMNNAVVYLFNMCDGILDQNGYVNSNALEYFKKCCHNTAHISALGVSALEVRAYRADPNSVTFGQVNYRGKTKPWLSELNNACNFLTDNELVTRTSVVKNGVSRILTYIENRGPVHFRDALKMFTYHSTSEYLDHFSKNWKDYPETAVDMVVNAPDRYELRSTVGLAIEQYKNKFYPNGVFTPYNQPSINDVMQILTNEALRISDLNNVM